MEIFARYLAAKTPPERSYSRAVEFDVDDDAMLVRQVWSHDGREQNQHKASACYQGGCLPVT